MRMFVVKSKETGKSYEDIKKGFSGVCRRAGIKDLHFHDLRHKFASHLVMVRRDRATVREFVGAYDIDNDFMIFRFGPVA
jgi:site-specific recombinase XerD